MPGVLGRLKPELAKGVRDGLDFIENDCGGETKKNEWHRNMSGKALSPAWTCLPG